MSPCFGSRGTASPRPGNYPSRRARRLWAPASRARLRRRPHRLPLQRPSSTMAPTSALVTVSEGMTASPSLPSLEPLVSTHDNSRARRIALEPGRTSRTRTAISPRRLGSALSHPEEDAVLVGKVRPRRRSWPTTATRRAGSDGRSGNEPVKGSAVTEAPACTSRREMPWAVPVRRL